MFPTGGFGATGNPGCNLVAEVARLPRALGMDRIPGLVLVFSVTVLVFDAGGANANSAWRGDATVEYEYEK